MDGTTFSALPSGSGVQAIANGQTSMLPVTAPGDFTILQSGDSQNEYILAGTTLRAGEAAFTSAGTTYSALPSGLGVLVAAGGTTFTASTGGAIDGNDADSAPTAVLLPDASQQLVTIGGRTYTAYATSGSLLVIDGETITPGVTTVINGETVVLTGTNLVLVTGTSTSTRGLGDAIVSGIGGGYQESTSTSESEAEQTTSGAERGAMLCSIVGVLSFVFAVALM